jgi:hypothetical protein
MQAQARELQLLMEEEVQQNDFEAAALLQACICQYISL